MLRSPTRTLAFFALPLLVSCGPKVIYSDADVPKIDKLEDVMWAQSQAMDPQFKKSNQTAFTDEEFVALASAGGRLELTTARLTGSFSKGPEFNQFATELAAHGAELASAANAKNALGSTAALKATKATCKACHAKFK